MMQKEIIQNLKNESTAVLKKCVDLNSRNGVKKNTSNKVKILVMDGDETIRVTVKLVLQRMNYEVETPNHVNEAIDLYKRARENHKPFDAVIMDLKVPDGMGGCEAINRLIEIDPETKVIVSDYRVSDPILENFDGYGVSAFLLKPFNIDSLSKTLHEVTMGNMNSGVVSWLYKDN